MARYSSPRAGETCLPWKSIEVLGWWCRWNGDAFCNHHDFWAQTSSRFSEPQLTNHRLLEPGADIWLPTEDRDRAIHIGIADIERLRRHHAERYNQTYVGCLQPNHHAFNFSKPVLR